jgi:hypothetical protein
MKVEVLSLTYMELLSGDITNLVSLLLSKQALQLLLSTLPLIVPFLKIIVRC